MAAVAPPSPRAIATTEPVLGATAEREIGEDGLMGGLVFPGT